MGRFKVFHLCTIYCKYQVCTRVYSHATWLRWQEICENLPVISSVHTEYKKAHISWQVVLCLTALTGKIRWIKNWVTFMDCMLQAWLFVDDTPSLIIPTEIQKLTINMTQHIVYLQSLDVNAEQGEFQTSFFCTCSGECIDFTSFKSAVMWCGVTGCVVPDVLDYSAFKTWVTTCPVTQFHVSEDESTAMPLWECQIWQLIASQVGLLHIVKSLRS